jgi:hypothetical protein
MMRLGPHSFSAWVDLLRRSEFLRWMAAHPNAFEDNRLASIELLDALLEYFYSPFIVLTTLLSSELMSALASI